MERMAVLISKPEAWTFWTPWWQLTCERINGSEADQKLGFGDWKVLAGLKHTRKWALCTKIIDWTVQLLHEVRSGSFITSGRYADLAEDDTIIWILAKRVIILDKILLIRLRIMCRILEFSSRAVTRTVFRSRLRYDPANPQLARSYRTHARWLPKDDLLDTMQFRWKMLTKKAIQASDKEVEENPRSRSAKLRAAFKID